MEKELVGGRSPSLLIDYLHQFELYLFGVIRIDQVKPLGYPPYMGIHYNSRLSKAVAKDHIGRLPSDAWEGCQVLHIVRDLAAESFA